MDVGWRKRLDDARSKLQELREVKETPSIPADGLRTAIYRMTSLTNALLVFILVGLPMGD
jgi:hypothetical protein